MRLAHAFRDAATDNYIHVYGEVAQTLITRDEGLMFLFKSHLSPADDLLNYLLNCPDDMVPTVVEAMAVAFATASTSYGGRRWEASRDFTLTVNTVLREHRISFELLDQRMVEFSSRELHESVMLPTLRLLAGDARYERAETAYRDALTEISKGKPSDAITDAGTALQEMLVALGCQGNALGPLIKSARSGGLLASHDGPLMDAVERTMHWVSADRSEMGDAHSASDASIEDAWFIVHVVGAVLLRLSHGTARK